MTAKSSRVLEARIGEIFWWWFQALGACMNSKKPSDPVDLSFPYSA